MPVLLKKVIQTTDYRSTPEKYWWLIKGQPDSNCSPYWSVATMFIGELLSAISEIIIDTKRRHNLAWQKRLLLGSFLRDLMFQMTGTLAQSKFCFAMSDIQKFQSTSKCQALEAAVRRSGVLGILVNLYR
jgi:hypothetical protein